MKSAVLLAGLFAEGETTVVEPAPTRDHTERMLGALDVPLEVRSDREVAVTAGEPQPFELTVPGDASSAAFFVVAASIVPGSDLTLTGVSINPRRIGYVDILREMANKYNIKYFYDITDR